MNTRSKVLLGAATLLVLFVLFFAVFFLSSLKTEQQVPSPVVPEVTPSPQQASAVTQQEAETVVTALPEVQKFIEAQEGTNPQVSVQDESTDAITLEVANTIQDDATTAHTESFNWYMVDKKTGQVKCSMYIYDASGNFVRAANIDEYPC